ncbi:MAG: arginine--tRNA ligase [Hyphomicrobiaceae bacterium]
MNIFEHFEQHLGSAVAELVAEGFLPTGLAIPRLTLEPTREASHGDLAANAAMLLAKPAGKKPREIAEAIGVKLAKVEGIAKVAVAGPGFINLTIDRVFWTKVVGAIVRAGDSFGKSAFGKGKKVNVEYVSANPTGPLHVGHCRGAVFGDALASLLAFTGHEVTREYYTNDAGSQIDVLARSAYLRYREALGESIGEIPEGLYPGDYLKPVGQALAEQHGKTLLAMPEAEWLPLVRAFAVERMLELIQQDLALLNIHHDVFFSEKSLHDSGAIRETVESLKKDGLVFWGRIPPPKGQPPDDWEDREQWLFRTTDFGDDIDRPLQKNDGTYAYFAADVAYAKSKIERGFDKLIYVLGADHGGYVKRLKAVASALSAGRVELDVRLCQLVKLFRNGEPVRMSKRSGNFEALSDLVEEVGSDAVRFMMLYRKNEAPLDFDFTKVTERSRENPVFYVQYAHARCHSVFRNAIEAIPDLKPQDPKLADAPLDRLTDEAETVLIRHLGQFPRLVEQAAAADEPHRVAFYLYDLASEFHALWNRGKDSPHLRFIREEDRSLTEARMAMVAATARVLASGLAILGVQAPEEMR